MQPIRKLLDDKFPDMQRIETKSLHKGVAGARHTFLRQQPGQNKLDLLVQVSTLLSDTTLHMLLLSGDGLADSDASSCTVPCVTPLCTALPALPSLLSRLCLPVLILMCILMSILQRYVTSYKLSS